jgi:hypothetical protein
LEAACALTGITAANGLPDHVFGNPTPTASLRRWRTRQFELLNE